MKFHIAEAKVSKQFYKEVDGKKVYIVDGSVIRKNYEADFTNFSQHYEFPNLIPEGEIWLDKEAEGGETDYFITHALTEYNKMAKGEDFDTAHEEGAKTELNQRRKTMQKANDVRIKLWKKLEKSKIKIFIVDGEAVRNQYNVDFTEGGHWLVYNFIPQGEIWVDNDVEYKERKYILAHELFELGAMNKRGLPYEQAHKLALRYEKSLRQKS